MYIVDDQSSCWLKGNLTLHSYMQILGIELMANDSFVIILLTSNFIFQATNGETRQSGNNDEWTTVGRKGEEAIIIMVY